VAYEGGEVDVDDRGKELDRSLLTPLRDRMVVLGQTWKDVWFWTWVTGLAVFLGVLAPLASLIKKILDMSWYEEKRVFGDRARKKDNLIEQDEVARRMMHFWIGGIGGIPHYAKRLRMMRNIGREQAADRHVSGRNILPHTEFIEAVVEQCEGVQADFDFLKFYNEDAPEGADKITTLRIPNKMFKSHALMVASTGMGKTVYLRTPMLSIARRNKEWFQAGKPRTLMFIFDRKPEFGGDIDLFDPNAPEGMRGMRLGLTDQRSVTWSLFMEILQSRQPQLACRNIAKILIAGSGKGDQFWDDCARIVFEGTLMACVLEYHENPKACTYGNLLDIFFSRTNLDKEDANGWDNLYDLLSKHPETAAATDFLSKAEAERKLTKSTWVTVIQKLDFLKMFARWKDDLPEDSFSITQWVKAAEQGTGVEPHLIVNFDPEFGEATKSVLHTWFFLAFNIALTLPEQRDGDDRVRIAFVLDELASILGSADDDSPVLASFINLLQVGRSLGCSVLGCLQDYGSVTKKMGKDNWESIENNFTTKVVGKVRGFNTRKMLSEMFGEMEIERSNTSTTHGTADMADRDQRGSQLDKKKTVSESMINDMKALDMFVEIETDLTKLHLHPYGSPKNGLAPLEHIDNSILGSNRRVVEMDLDDQDDTFISLEREQ